MSTGELITGAALAVILIVLAVFFGLRQRLTLRMLGDAPLLGDDEKRYYRAQVSRRLLCSVLMILFAGMLVGWFFLESHFRQAEPGEGPPEYSRDALPYFATYWGLALLLLLAMVILALVDFLATARFGMRQKRQLELDHHSALEAEAARLRRRYSSGE